MSDEEEENGGIHVDSGSFRVDRRRALDKLMRFQLPQAEMFMLPWVRAAVASGASYVKIAALQDALELRFDGRPFERAELADPYSCLFDKHTPQNRRNRELAIGLLSVMRLSPQFVSLVSGPAGKRLRLRAESVQSERVDEAEDPSTETSIKVIPGASTPELWNEERAEWVERLCRVCPIPLFLSGEEAMRARNPTHPPGLYFEEGPIRGWLTVPAELAAVSTFQAYTLGVFVAPTQAQLPRFQVEGYINDDQFTLSASQTAVARNSRFRGALEIVAKRADQLLVQLCQGHRERMEAAAKAAMDGELLYYWRSRLERGGSAEKPSPLEGAKESVKGALKLLAGVDLKKRQEAIEEIYWTARATVWLREAAGRLLKDSETDPRDPLLAALWSAPIQFGISGTALSLMDLEIQRRRLGYVPVSQRAAPGRALPFEAVWVTSARDVEVLVRRFPDLIRDVTDHLDTISAAQQKPVAGRVTLEQAGLADVLAREVFELAGTRGEVGLALIPHERAARLTLVRDGTPAQFFELPSELRFEAALEAVEGGPKPGLDAALKAAASSLYPKLLAEYDCWKPGERSQAIRDHLLDYLASLPKTEPAAEAAPGGVLPPAPTRWIETVPLFDFVDSWVDYQRLRAAVREGRPVFLAPDRSHASGYPGKMVLAGRRFTAGFLKRLLPESRVIDPSATSLKVLVSEPPALGCKHKADCLIERSVGGKSVHLALTGPGTRLELPWGQVTAFSPDQLSDDDVNALSQDYRLVIDMISALLKRLDKGLVAAGQTERAFLLDALQHLLAPWPGRGPARPRQNLIEFLDVLPLFKQPSASGWTIGQVAQRLGAGLDAVYVRPEKAKELPDADLILDERELAFLQALFPGWHKRLVEGRPGPAEPGKAAAAASAAAATAPAADYAPPVHLTFEEPMLFSRLYTENGLSARIGLPSSSAQPSLSVFRNGKAVDWPHAPRFVGAARVEIGGWKGKSAPQPEAVQALLHRFYLDLADHWPVADPSSLQHAAAVEQVLKLMLLHAEPGFPARQANEQRERLGTLKMFRTLGGGFASLLDLAALARERQGLPYAEREFLPVPDSMAAAPVLTGPLTKLLASVLEMKLHVVKPSPKPEPTAVEEPEAPKEDRPEAEGLVRARSVLRHLRGRRGLKLRTAKVVLAQDADPSAPLVTQTQSAWVVQPYHPSMMAILGSDLSPEEQGAYLASMIYTAANRLLEDVTDHDDIKFQQALADFIASPEPAAETKEAPPES